MRKVYLMTMLLLVINYIFFIDKFQGEIKNYMAEIEKMEILQNVDVKKDYNKDVLELTGLQVIENVEREILRDGLISINKTYAQNQDENGYKIHELSFVLQGDNKLFRKFLENDIFTQEYNIKELSIYKEEDKELMEVFILVRSL